MPTETKILLHAPTPGAYARAKNNLRNIQKDAPETEVEIIVNAKAAPDAMNDPERNDKTLLCDNSLRTAQLNAPQSVAVVPNAMLHIARRKQEGWIYIRA